MPRRKSHQKAAQGEGCFDSPLSLRTPTPHRPIRGDCGPPYWMYPLGTGDREKTTQGENCTIRCPPHHGGATRGGAFKRVARTVLRFCRTVATGGRTAMRQRAPRAGIFAPVSRTKLPRKRGPGGGRLRAPLGARRRRSPAIFSPLLDRSKRGSPPAGGEIPPNQTARYKTGGSKPPPYRVRFSWRTTTRRALCPCTTPLCYMGTARRGRGPGRSLLALWANSPSRAPRKWSLLPVLPGAP